MRGFERSMISSSKGMPSSARVMCARCAPGKVSVDRDMVEGEDVRGKVWQWKGGRCILITWARVVGIEFDRGRFGAHFDNVVDGIVNLIRCVYLGAVCTLEYVSRRDLNVYEV